MGATTLHKRDRPIFYVYEYWRPDTGRCFWVGKGHGDRATRRCKRNFYFDNVVAVLERNGLSFDVRIVRGAMTEREALDFEISQIAYRRSQGEPLTNMTIGGEGVCGLTHSEETRRALSEISSRTLIGRPVSEETRAKMSAAHAGRNKGVPNPEHSVRLKGRKHSTEHKAKISESGKGRKHSPEALAKMAAARIGRKASPETREKLRISHLGIAITTETRERMRQAHRARRDGPQGQIDKEKRGAIMRALWADPAYREAVLSARAARRASKLKRA